MIVTAREVYDKLVKEDRILESAGRITFSFDDVNIIVKQKGRCRQHHPRMGSGVVDKEQY